MSLPRLRMRTLAIHLERILSEVSCDRDQQEAPGSRLLSVVKALLCSVRFVPRRGWTALLTVGGTELFLKGFLFTVSDGTQKLFDKNCKLNNV